MNDLKTKPKSIVSRDEQFEKSMYIYFGFLIYTIYNI